MKERIQTCGRCGSDAQPGPLCGTEKPTAASQGSDSGLLPCPFCGMTVKVYGDDHPTFRLCRVMCLTDGCPGQHANFLSRADAIAAWNRRRR